MKYMDSQITPLLIKSNRELKIIVNNFEKNFKILEDECQNLRELIFARTHYEQEIEESPNITEESDIGRGINHALLIQQSQQDYYPKWNRFLFAWNRI
jgi:hypothetical protein